MFDLEIITVRQFFELDETKAERYLSLQNILNPLPKLGNKKATALGELSYGEVAQLKRNIAEPTVQNIFESFQMVFKIKWVEFITTDIVSFFYAINWIRTEIKELSKREAKALKSEKDPDLEMAGVKRLQPFGEFSTLIGLGEKFGKAPTEIENWKYNVVFTIMFHDKIYNEVAKNYQEIKSKQNPNGRKRSS